MIEPLFRSWRQTTDSNIKLLLAIISQRRLFRIAFRREFRQKFVFYEQLLFASLTEIVHVFKFTIQSVEKKIITSS